MDDAWLFLDAREGWDLGLGIWEGVLEVVLAAPNLQSGRKGRCSCN